MSHFPEFQVNGSMGSCAGRGLGLERGCTSCKPLTITHFQNVFPLPPPGPFRLFFFKKKKKPDKSYTPSAWLLYSSTSQLPCGKLGSVSITVYHVDPCMKPSVYDIVSRRSMNIRITLFHPKALSARPSTERSKQTEAVLSIPY